MREIYFFLCNSSFLVAGFSDSLVIKNPPANARDASLIPGNGNGNPFKYSCLENPMDRGAWWVTVHGVTKELDTTEQLNNNSNSVLVPQLVESSSLQNFQYLVYFYCVP